MEPVRIEHVIGIDAGGSNTRIVVASKDLFETGKPNAFEEMTFGPANFCTLGEAGIRNVIRDLLAHAPTKTPHQTFVLSGFAGAGDPDDRETITRLFEMEGFRRENIVVTSDAGLLIMAMGGTGIALIAGTGSICAGSRESRPDRWGDIDVRAGGYGERIPSETGGYRLGIRAIDAALRIADGREEVSSSLTRDVRDYFRLDDVRLVPSILYPSNEIDRSAVTMIVAGLAGRVLQAAHEGDRIACVLVEETVSELVDLVRAVLGRMGPGHTVIGLHGGLFADRHGEDLLIIPLRERLKRMGHELTYLSFGIENGDPDPLLEALKFAVTSCRKRPTRRRSTGE